MSSEARPISSAQFALALKDLPVETLYSKVSEIQNSIAHLARSNKDLEEYSTSVGSDPDCIATVRENEEVAERMKERTHLIKREVERRGQRWHEGEEDQQADTKPNGDMATTGGRLDDENLSRQLIERLAEHDREADQDGAGIHL